MGLTHAEEARVEEDVLLALRVLAQPARLGQIVGWLKDAQDTREVQYALQRMRKRGEVAYRWDGRVQRWGWVEL